MPLKIASKFFDLIFTRYLIIAGLAYFVDFCGYLLLIHLGNTPLLSNALIKIVAGVFGFFGHRFFTYSIKENKFIFMHAIKYFGLALIYTPASSFCLFFSIKIFNDPIIGKITSDIFLFALIFWVTSKFSFKNNFLGDRR
jgi:hypothetical protein